MGREEMLECGGILRAHRVEKNELHTSWKNRKIGTYFVEKFQNGIKIAVFKKKYHVVCINFLCKYAILV
jgi:hypothetical protein